MEERKHPENVDYGIYLEDVGRSEKHAKHWMIACIIAFSALIGTNLGWIIYESQYEDVVTTTQTVTQETGSEGGTNTFTGDFYGGDYNGKADGN